jgi:hypothetical protein
MGFMENIFDAAGKMGKAKKDKSAIPKPEKKIDKNDELSNLTIEDMLQKMQDMKKDLEGQLDSIYKQGAAKRINVDRLIEESGGLAVKNLDKIKDQEKILSDKINEAILPESCLKKKPKSKEALTQERKGKLRGSRHNWIPVR